MYTFARCQPDSKYPDLQGWYLILRPGDFEALMELHTGVCHLYFSKFAMDPHLAKERLPGAYSPVVLAESWLKSVERYLLAGITVVVNPSGGMLPLSDVKVLATIEAKKMSWPTHFEGEIITISRWPKGLHYYLSSNMDRIFVPSKYTKYEDALGAAEKYTDKIKLKSV